MWRWFYAIRARLHALLGSARSDRDLNDELSFHVAMQKYANEVRGMSSAEAERRARLSLDGVQQLKERLHEQRSILWFDHLRQDVTVAIRMIFRTKVVSLAVIVTFALGIGANTAIFSLIDSVLLSPLPYDSPERIVTVEPFWTNTGQANTVSSAPDFRDWRQQNHVFDSMAFHAGREVRVVANGTPSFASVQLVTPDFFNVFGVRPTTGRLWSETEERTPLAVVSHAWAIGQFGDVDAAIGKTIEAVGQPLEIVGVASPGFAYPGSTNIPIRLGRDFGDGDRLGRPQVAIVNERLAREAFGSDYPLGRIIRTGMTPESMNGMQIVGVVADARQRSPETAARPEIFMPYLQHPGPGSRLTLLAQTSLDPGVLTGSIREASRTLNAGVPMRFSTMEDVFNKALAYPRFRAVLVASFALLAVMLALVGIYSVLSYHVAEQTPEIGVRLALGALRRDIFNRVIGGSMRLVFGGVIVGLVLALIAAKAIETMLFDVSARDPMTIVAVIALLAVTALTASSIPALRAASVDPLVALRDE